MFLLYVITCPLIHKTQHQTHEQAQHPESVKLLILCPLYHRVFQSFTIFRVISNRKGLNQLFVGRLTVSHSLQHSLFHFYLDSFCSVAFHVCRRLSV